MRESPELRQYVSRLFQAAASGDEAALLAAVSQQQGVLVIGTDPAEWWSGYGAIKQVLNGAREDDDASGGVMSEAEVLAYEADSVGWAACRARVAFPGQAAIPLRVTCVCQREEGAWRVVQWHVSLGVPNEDTFRETVIIQAG
jgi:adenylate cyclase